VVHNSGSGHLQVAIWERTKEERTQKTGHRTQDTEYRRQKTGISGLGPRGLPGNQGAGDLVIYDLRLPIDDFSVLIRVDS
jgi:hypothetical protein